MQNEKIAMKQKVLASYIKYGVLCPGREFKENFPPVGERFIIQADNMSFLVHIDEQNRIAFKKWPNWDKVKLGDTIILYELTSGKQYRVEHISGSSVCSTTNSEVQKEESWGKYDEEQKQIIDMIKKEVEGLNKIEDKDWKKYKGAITAHVIISHIKPYLPDNLTIVGHDYFIYRHRTEWDAMIVKKNAKPHLYLNTYEPDDVKAVIEIKQSGFYDKIQEVIDLDYKLRKLEEKHGIKGMVVVCSTSGKINFRGIKNPFVLSRNSNINNYRGEWKRLLDFVKELEL